MHKYVINDIHMALKLSMGNFFGVMFLMVVTLFLIPYFLLFQEYISLDIFGMTVEFAILFSIVMTPMVLIQSIFIYFANRRYEIDLETGLITFPRTDIENSILAIILMHPYWNLMRTKTIHASEIENLYLDTKKWSTKHQVATGQTASGKTKFRTETKRHTRYAMNITGTFGSANLEFLGRQKRDEVRNAIQKCVKQHSDINIDRKVAEFN